MNQIISDFSTNYLKSLNQSFYTDDDLVFKVDFTCKRTAFIMTGPVHPNDIIWVLQRISSCSIVIVHQWLINTEISSGALSPIYFTNEEIHDKRLHWSIDNDLDISIQKALKHIDKDIFDGWQPVLSKHEITEPSSQTLKVIRRFGDFINSDNLGRNTKLLVPSKVLKNALINLPRADLSFDNLNNAVENRRLPSLIVAAGPSLTKQLPLLRKYQKYFFIIAVDGIWELLNSHEIIPDIVISLDPLNTPGWAKNALNPKTELWADVGCDPALIDSNNNRSILTYHIPEIGLLVDKLGGKVKFLGTGGSVATSAFCLACQNGANLIVLIGQDLALTGGKDHADGYHWETKEEVLDNKINSGFDTDGYYGDRVRTEPQLLFYKNWYQDKIKEIGSQIIVVNSTEGGAKIDGALQIPFLKICEEAEKMTVGKSFNNCTSHGFNSDYVRNLITQIDFLVDRVKTLRLIAEEGRKILKVKHSNNKVRNFKKIDNINHKIRNYDIGTKAIINIFGSLHFAGIKREVKRTEKPKNKDEIVVEKYVEIYDEIIRNCVYVEARLPRLQEYFSELIKSRLFFIPDLAERIWCD